VLGYKKEAKYLVIDELKDYKKLYENKPFQQIHQCTSQSTEIKMNIIKH